MSRQTLTGSGPKAVSQRLPGCRSEHVLDEVYEPLGARYLLTRQAGADFDIDLIVPELAAFRRIQEHSMEARRDPAGLLKSFAKGGNERGVTAVLKSLTEQQSLDDVEHRVLCT